MFSKPLAFGILALGCVTAAAGGAYLATRHNAAERQATSAAVAAGATDPVAPAPETAERTVPATDAAVTPAAPSLPALQPAPAAARATSPAAAEKRQTPARRPGGAKAPDSKPVAASRPAENVATRQPARTVPFPDRPQAVAALPSVAPSEAMSRVATDASSSATSDTPHSDGLDTPAPAQFDELLLPTASVIGLQLETGLTSERAHVEDRVEARVTRDVVIDGRLAIPAGARMIGSVTQVDRGGKMKERARLAIRFHTLVLGNGDEVALRTEQITREGEAPAPGSSKKIGGAAVGGAILGAILGGGKGAMIGGIAGAGGGTAMVMAGDHNPATFPAGAIVTAHLASPVTIGVRRDPR
jgi:hypothetical protein